MSDWISVSKPPKKDGRYLVTIALLKFRMVDVLYYAKDLAKANEFDFWNMEGKSGWYESNSEYGDSLVYGVLAWQELPEIFGGEPCR